MATPKPQPALEKDTTDRHEPIITAPEKKFAPLGAESSAIDRRDQCAPIIFGRALRRRKKKGNI